MRRMSRLIYYSMAVPDFRSHIQSVIQVAQANNLRDDITGILFYRTPWIFQVLEGSRTNVTATFKRILNDTRHKDVSIISFDEVGKRMFPTWQMEDLSNIVMHGRLSDVLQHDLRSFDPSDLPAEAAMRFLAELVKIRRTVAA